MAAVTSLDKITRNILLKRRYPLAYYLEFLVFCKDGLRELSFDLPINPLRYKLITLNSLNQGELPNDYVDYARVQARIGQYLQPLVEENALDTIPNYDSTFTEQPYLDGVATEQNSDQLYYLPNGYLSPYWWMVNWNSFGENLGRQFGGAGTMNDTFKIDKTRNIIKVNETLDVCEVVLEYIGNGLDGDSATHIHVYVQAALESYALWQFKECNRTYSEGEAQVAKRDFEQQVTILRARLSDLTMDKLKRIVTKNYSGIKY